MKPATLLTTLLASLAAATDILLPLYLYPGNNAAAWAPVFSAVSAHPAVSFQIIINPDDGPGGTRYPDSNFIAGITKLKSYANVALLGYVHTRYTREPAAAVRANVSAYARWANHAPQAIGVDGIFFDEVKATAQKAPFTYIKALAAFAYNTIPTSTTYVVLNPGELASNHTGTNYFSVADTVVEFESPYADYKGLSTVQSVGSYAGQSAILVVQTPANVDLAGAVHTIVSNGIGATYFTKGCCYMDLSLLGNLTNAVAAG